VSGGTSPQEYDMRGRYMSDVEHGADSITLRELGAITVSMSACHRQVYVYDYSKAVIFVISYKEIVQLGGDLNMDIGELTDWVVHNYSREIIETLVEKQYG